MCICGVTSGILQVNYKLCRSSSKSPNPLQIYAVDLLCPVKDLSRDIYDLYAEYEREEVDDRLPVSPSRILRSPTKHLNLNINVGGTVTGPAFFFFLTQTCDWSSQNPT